MLLNQSAPACVMTEEHSLRNVVRGRQGGGGSLHASSTPQCYGSDSPSAPQSAGGVGVVGVVRVGGCGTPRSEGVAAGNPSSPVSYHLALSFEESLRSHPAGREGHHVQAKVYRGSRPES